MVFSGTVNAKVGFDAGFGGTYTSPTLGTGAADFKFTKATGAQGPDTVRKVLFGGNAIQFKANTSSGAQTLRVFSAGKTWSTAGAQHLGAGHVASIIGLNKTPFPGDTGLGSFTDKFALISFTSGINTLFGWIELSLVANGNGSPHGPDLTIVSYAYDDTGAHLAAGDTVSAPAPEPATFAMTGLAALALGAAGIRRYKASRQNA